MGKGDQRSKRGKIIVGSYGVKRKKRDPLKKYTPSEKAVKPAEAPVKQMVEAPVVKSEEVEATTSLDEAKLKAPKKKATVKAKAENEDINPEETTEVSAE